MKDRFFELAKQADIINWDTLLSGARTPDYESVVKAKKFAELIVQECCNIMTEHAHRPAGVVKRNVKEHFGIK